MNDWHRIFGMTVAVTVTGRPIRVVQEVELSKIRQRLDLAISLTKDAASQRDWPDLPDGLTDLAQHSLVTYKSIRESLSSSSMLELISHAVAFAKQEWKNDWAAAIVDPGRLRAIAVATQRPVWLKLESLSGLTTIAPGVYEATTWDLGIRIVVPREVELVPRNALWHLLSGDSERVAYGLEHCDCSDPMLYNVLNDLRITYALEGVEMPYTLEDYRREKTLENIEEMTSDELTWFVKNMSREKLAALRKDVLADERLDGLSPDELEVILKRLKSRNGNDESV